MMYELVFIKNRMFSEIINLKVKKSFTIENIIQNFTWGTGIFNIGKPCPFCLHFLHIWNTNLPWVASAFSVPPEILSDSRG